MVFDDVIQAIAAKPARNNPSRTLKFARQASRISMPSAILWKLKQFHRVATRLKR